MIHSLRNSGGVIEANVGRSVVESLDVPWGGLEEGWLLLGEREESGLLVTHTIKAGPKSQASPSFIEFDKVELLKAFRELRLPKDNRGLEPVGIAHTHPPPSRCPSPTDLTSDLEWIRGKPDPFIFCIVCNGLTWWLLRDGWTNYERLEYK